jgi:RHS repeat-associated protein
VVIKSVAYTYDVNNRRIGKVVDNDGVGAAAATVERFVYNGNQIGLVFDGGGNQTHRYLYGAGVDQILADETVSGTNWAVTDKLGTVTDVIDNNGLVLNHIVYDSFGKVVTKSDTSFEFRYGFTGREYDGETGLDYYRARYYDSGNGRFISEDPIGFDAGDSNLTRYVGNSPTNLVDPSGLRPKGGFTPVDGDQSIFTGGGLQRGAGGIPGGGLPSGSGFGTNSPKLIPPPRLPEPLSLPLPLPTPTPRPRPTPKPRSTPTIPNPNCPEEKEETCESKYPAYALISEATSNPRVAFKGFIYNDLPSTIKDMKTFRTNHLYIQDRRKLFSETVIEKDGKKIDFGGGIKKSNDLFPDPDGQARHYNIYIQGTNEQSGGSAGKYRFCQEGKPPQLIWKFGIFNIKDENGNPYYKST